MQNLIRMRWHFGFLLAVVAAGVLGVYACTTPENKAEQKAESVTSDLSTDEQKKVEELQAELEIGRNMAGRLLEFYGVYEDPKLVRYLNEVAALVAANSEFPDRRYMIDIIEHDQPNAFACPGGYILLTVGALKNARSEAELAAVIGHEIAHVGLQHMFDQLKQMDEEKLDEMAGEGEKEQSLPSDIAVRKRPEPEESSAIETVARYVAGSAAGLNVLKAAKAGMSMILEKGLGADLEYEADQAGIQYAVNAGYYPYALLNYLCRIKISQGGSKEDCFQKAATQEGEPETILEKTHPPIPQRIARLQTTLQTMEAKSIVGAKGKRRFLHYQRRLTRAASNSTD
jgi:predicted Zn-dependent protease